MNEIEFLGVPDPGKMSVWQAPTLIHMGIEGGGFSEVLQRLLGGPCK